MSQRGVNASLEEQMAKLHDNMSARDKRRNQQHDMRQVCPRTHADQRVREHKHISGTAVSMQQTGDGC